MQDQVRFKVELLADGKPKFLNKQAGNAAFYYFVLDDENKNGERWLAKGVMYDPSGRILPPLAIVQSDMAKELIANQLYAQFGIPVARLTTAMLPIYFKEDNIWAEIAQELGLQELPAVLSRFLDHFNDYGDLTHKNIPDLRSNQPYFTLSLDDQSFPEVGLGRVLAVAHWIGDVDVIGGSGGNVGYRFRQHPDFGLIIETCKIDPGVAFKDFELDSANEIPSFVQLAPNLDDPLCQTEWKQWSQQTQAEYWETIKAIINYPAEKLIELFQETDPDKQFIDYDVCLQRLLVRQDTLRLRYREYQIEYKPNKKIIELPNLTQLQSDNPIGRLSTQQQLLLSSVSVQQAFNFYITPFVLVDANAQLESRQDWLEQLAAFTELPDKKVLLLLGVAGAGKSIETYRCLNYANMFGYISLRIELKRFTETSVRNCVSNTLQDDYQLTPQQIEGLKEQPFLIILDGYDEIAGHPRINLYNSNKLEEWPNSKLIITCRSQYFTHEMRDDFIPKNNRQELQEWHIAPLDETQMRFYLEQYKDFDVESCWSYLEQHPEAKALLTTPLMLKLLIDAWPQLNKDTLHLTRYDLHEAFFAAWEALQEVRTIQQLGCYENLTPRFRQFSEELAWALYTHEQVSVNYENDDVNSMWHRFFTEQDPHVIKARLGCPLTRKGTEYRFLHKSFTDHLVARQLWLSLTQDPFKICLQKWNQRFLVDERAILNILAEKLQVLSSQTPEVKRLFKLIKGSKKQPQNAQAASNAISVLNLGYKTLAHRDFRDTNLHRADLSWGCCRESDFARANLSGVNLRQANLLRSNFAQANLSAIDFGEQPYVKVKGWIHSIACSPDGRYLAVAVDNNIILRDLYTGQELYTLKGHMDSVYSVTLSNKIIISGSKDQTIRAWNLQTGQLQFTLKGHMAGVKCVTLSGEKIVSGSLDCTIRVWNLRTGKCQLILEGHTKPVTCISFSDETLVSGSGDETIRVWDLQSGQCRLVLQGHKSIVESVLLSGELIVSGGSWDHNIRVWDLKTGECRLILQGHTGYVNSVVLSEKTIVSGSSDQTVRVWDMRTGYCRFIFRGHTRGGISSVMLSGNTIVSAGMWDNTIRIWDLQAGYDQHTQQRHIKNVECVAIKDEIIMSGNDDQSICVWSVQTGQCRKILQGHFYKGPIRSVTFTGEVIVSASWDCTVCVWDLRKGKYRHILKGHTNWVTSVSLSGDTIVSGSWDQTVCVWSLQTGQCQYILKGHTGAVTTVSCSGEKIVSGSRDSTVRVWDLQSRKCQLTLQGHTEAVTSISLSCKIIVSGSEDRTIRVWDLQTGQCRFTLEGHTDNVTSVSLSGETIASGSEDKTVRVWDMYSQQCKQIIHFAFKISSVALSEQGELVVGMSKSVYYYAHNAQGKYQLVWSNPSSECLQLNGASIYESIGLSLNNLTLMEQRGATKEQIQVEEAMEETSELLEKQIEQSAYSIQIGSESQNKSNVSNEVSEASYASIQLSQTTPRTFLPLKRKGESLQIKNKKNKRGCDELKNNNLILDKMDVDIRNSSEFFNEGLKLKKNEYKNFSKCLQIFADALLGRSVEKANKVTQDFLNPLIAKQLPLADILGTLLAQEAGLNHVQTQVNVTENVTDTLCIELSLEKYEIDIFINRYQGLLLSTECSGYSRLQVVFNAQVFESVLLPLLVERYQEQEEQRNEKNRVFGNMGL